MNRKEYLEQLEKYLRCLPKEDFARTMNHFVEYFDEVGEEGEQDAIKELGKPKEVAYELLSQLLETGERPSKKINLGEKSYSQQKKDKPSPAGVYYDYGNGKGEFNDKKQTYQKSEGDKNRQDYYDYDRKNKLSIGAIIAISILAILASPIAIPLAVAAVAIIIAIVAVVGAAILAAILMCIAGLIASVKLFVAGVLTVTASIWGAIAMVGMGTAALGGCMILIGVTALCVGLLGRGIRWFAKWITGFGGKKNENMD